MADHIWIEMCCESGLNTPFSSTGMAQRFCYFMSGQSLYIVLATSYIQMYKLWKMTLPMFA